MDLTNLHVEVLMATWNGDRFLEEQLESLFAQTFQNFSLIVRDDGSTDSTLEIIHKYRLRYPKRVVVCRNPVRLGACRNFALLIEESSADYVAFCDQDDMWRKNKLAMSLEAIKEVENEYGREIPVLSFSDMTIVDEDKKVLVRSVWKWAHLNPSRASLGNMLVQNLVTGCTAMANRSLISKATPIPSDALMHDMWLGLVATAFGVLRPLKETMVQYRQHDRNAVGAGRRWSSANLLKNLHRDYQSVKQRVEVSRRQSELFARCYEKHLTDKQKRILAAWSKSEELPMLVRQWALHRNGLRGTTLHNHLGFLARV